MSTTTGNGAGRAHRDRHLRLFPKRLAELRLALTPTQLVGYLAVLMQYMQHGELPDDDRLLASLAGMTVKAWAEVRRIVIERGFARVEGGQFIDDDQRENLQRQQSYSEAQRAKALHRQQQLREVRHA